MPKGLQGFQKGHRSFWSKETKRKMSIIMTGRYMSEEAKRKISIAHIGMKASEETKQKLSRSLKGKLKTSGSFKKGQVAPMKGRKRPDIIGSKHPMWKGGITSLHDAIRLSAENKEWKIKVFQRDNHTCQDCGSNKSNTLEAHHLKRFAVILGEFLQTYSQFSPIEDKETLIRLAITYKPFWEISNGKTLCVDCHNLTRGRIMKGGSNEVK